jgi:murein L,D-transpeptidase YcbB/YkuD
MSTRIDGGTRGAPLVEDDDWFATVQQQTVELDDRSWENELEWQLRDPKSPDLGRRQAAIVLAVVVAVFLVFAGILIGRETKSSSTKVVTVAASQAEETPAATAAGDNSAATSTPSTSTPSTSTPSPTAVPTDATLRPGAEGAAVIALQQALTTLGYSPGTADGTYGATTAQAVTDFQTAKNLTADGAAGAQTLAAINAALASG